MMNHLKEIEMGYWKHWYRAMKISIALFIHAFYPDLFTNYASKRLEDG